MTQNKLNTLNPVIQIVTASRTTVLNCSAAMLRDDTIPQNTEGAEVLTATITPQSATSRLVFNFSGFATIVSTSVTVTAALFQDSTANALAAVCLRNSTGMDISLQYSMTSGTTSATTFKIRVGNGNSTGSVYLSGDSAGTQLMGGVACATLTIVEYRV